MALKPSYTSEELQELFANCDPPTEDDVSITDDGRRLDSVEAYLAFIEEIRVSRLEKEQQPDTTGT